MNAWATETGGSIGACMPVTALWQLSQHWYDGRLSPSWTPRSRDASQLLLADAGFVDRFWSLR